MLKLFRQCDCFVFHFINIKYNSLWVNEISLQDKYNSLWVSEISLQDKYNSLWVSEIYLQDRYNSLWASEISLQHKYNTNAVSEIYVFLFWLEQNIAFHKSRTFMLYISRHCTDIEHETKLYLKFRQ